MNGGPVQPESGQDLALGTGRLLVVVTGAVSAARTPEWLRWLKEVEPDLELRTLVTRSAEQFVSLTTLSLLSAGPVHRDEWVEDARSAIHVELIEWAEAVVVYPATLNFVARFALGMADTPALTVLQSTHVPIGVGPALPPGAAEAPAFRAHWATLVERPNVVLSPPLPGQSVSTGRVGEFVAADFVDLLRRVERLRARRAATLTAFAAAARTPPGDEDGLRTGDGFATGLLRTSITPADEDDWRWVRAPGDDAPAAFAPTSPALEQLIREVPERLHARLVPGEPVGDSRYYRVRGPRSVAAALLDGGPDVRLEPALHDVGQVLRSLHGSEAAATLGLDPPPPLRRMSRWLEGRSPSVGAARAEHLLRNRLTGQGFAALHGEMCDLVSAGGGVLCHGSPGLGSMVTDDGAEAVDLLTGEDLGTAPARYDLAFLVGELVELRWVSNADSAGWQSLVDALFAGYGSGLGDDWPRLAAVRIALHLHDFSAYVRWDADEAERYAGFLGFLLDA